MSVDTKQPRDNAGVLFRNVQKKRDTHPDYSGEALIGGREYRLAGWAREAKSGVKYLSVAFTPKDQPFTPKAKPITRQPGEDDEKLPF